MADNLARKLAVETARAGLSTGFVLGRINISRQHFYKIMTGDGYLGISSKSKLEQGIAMALEIQHVIVKNTGENHVAS